MTEAAAQAKTPAAAKPSKAALKRVQDLETKLAGMKADHDERVAAIAAEREALDRREAKQTGDYSAARSDLNARLKAARAALR